MSETCHCSCTCSAGPHPIVELAQQLVDALAAAKPSAYALWQERLRAWEGLRKQGGVGRYGPMSIYAKDRPSVFYVTWEPDPPLTTVLADACAEVLFKLGDTSPDGAPAVEAIAHQLVQAVEAEVASVRSPKPGGPL